MLQNAMRAVPDSDQNDQGAPIPSVRNVASTSNEGSRSSFIARDRIGLNATGRRQPSAACLSQATTLVALTAWPFVPSGLVQHLRSADQLDKLGIALELSELSRELLHRVHMMHRRQGSP